MTLKERLEDDYRQSFKKGEELRVATLRLLKAEVKNAEIAKRKDFDDNEVLDIIMRLAKRHQDSTAAFTKGGRLDLAEREKKQMAVLAEYLPEKLSEEELRDIISEMIEITKATGKKDLGKVMGVVMKKVKNQADGNLVRKIAAEELEKKEKNQAKKD